MAGNQTDAKNRAKRLLDEQEKSLRNMRRSSATSNEIRDQERRIDRARSAYDAAEADERAALGGCAKSWF